MKAIELARMLLVEPDKSVMIVSADMGVGTDTFAPLDDVRNEDDFWMLGATAKMTGDLPVPAK